MDTMYSTDQWLSSRREFLKGCSLGIAGIALSPYELANGASAEIQKPGVSKVSFTTGTDRREMVYQLLKPFEREIKDGIKGKQVVIKSNFVRLDTPLCATHADAVRGLLDFLTPIYKDPVVIGASTAMTDKAAVGFQNYGYMNLPSKYNVKLIDLNEEPSTTLWILDKNRYPLNIEIINTFLNPKNYIISLTRLKSHNAVVATLGIKNIVMGSPKNFYQVNNNEKSKMHEGGPVGINYNIFRIAEKVWPQLSILDGVEGMEGNGPSRGTLVNHGVALAGTDALAVDRVAVELMGINYSDIGYLQWCGKAGFGQDDLAKIKILGPDISSHKITYKLHETIEYQLKWKNG